MLPVTTQFRGGCRRLLRDESCGLRENADAGDDGQGRGNSVPRLVVPELELPS
jgi:hypothetical protein